MLVNHAQVTKIVDLGAVEQVNTRRVFIMNKFQPSIESEKHNSNTIIWNPSKELSLELWVICNKAERSLLFLFLC